MAGTIILGAACSAWTGDGEAMRGFVATGLGDLPRSAPMNRVRAGCAAGMAMEAGCSPLVVGLTGTAGEVAKA